MPADITTGQRLYLRFDEASGTNCVDSAGNYAGTVQPGATRVVGKYGKAIDCDGVTGLVSTTFNETLPNTSTIVCWVNSDASLANAGVVFSRGTVTTGINISPGGNVGYTWNTDPATYTWESGLALNTGQWNFLAIVINPTQATLYVSNGNTLNSATNVHAHNSSVVDALEVGRDSFPGRFFDGRIDEVRVYNVAKTLIDITALFTLTNGRIRQPAACGLLLGI